MKDITSIILKASEVGAIMASKNIGCEDKNQVDKSAVDAINSIFKNAQLPAQIVLGEGELDSAPQLYPGQKFNDEIKYDIAIDPVEGTKPVAFNNPGAIVSIAISKKGSMSNIPEMYMEKFFVSSEIKDFVNLEIGIEENIRHILASFPHKEFKAIVLNKPRHKNIIDFFKQNNIYVKLINDGDVMGAIDVVNGKADFVYGIGGSPEGALMASLSIASNCKMEWRLIPFDEIITGKTKDKSRAAFEKQEVDKSKYEYNRVYSCYDLVNDPKTMFVSSAITEGGTLKGVDYKNNKYKIMSILASKGVVRKMTSTYNLQKILKYDEDLQILRHKKDI